MTSTPSTRTQLTSQDKRKILAYMETLNAAQIRRFISEYKKTEKNRKLFIIIGMTSCPQ